MKGDEVLMECSSAFNLSNHS